MPLINQRVILKSRPKTVLESHHLAIQEHPVPQLGDGQVLIENCYISLDPGIRQRLSQVNSYARLIDEGSPLTTSTLGRIIASRHKGFSCGEHIVGFHTTETYSVTTPGPMTRKVDVNATASPSNHLSVLGQTGLTAYFGMLDIGKPQTSETVVVSGSAGAVGSIAGQIAKIKGCKVIGLAGGPEKCQRIRESFGFDGAIDYKGKSTDQLIDDLNSLCPEGIDIFFDNVGGVQLDAALACIKKKARIPLCGLISQYDTGNKTELSHLFQVIAKSARIEGFVVLDYSDRFQGALHELGNWINTGKLTFREEIEEGIEAIIPSLLKLFDGSNQGKVLVKLNTSSQNNLDVQEGP